MYSPNRFSAYGSSNAQGAQKPLYVIGRAVSEVQPLATDRAVGDLTGEGLQLERQAPRQAPRQALHPRAGNSSGYSKARKAEDPATAINSAIMKHFGGKGKGKKEQGEGLYIPGLSGQGFQLMN